MDSISFHQIWLLIFINTFFSNSFSMSSCVNLFRLMFVSFLFSLIIHFAFYPYNSIPWEKRGVERALDWFSLFNRVLFIQFSFYPELDAWNKSLSSFEMQKNTYWFSAGVRGHSKDYEHVSLLKKEPNQNISNFNLREYLRGSKLSFQKKEIWLPFILSKSWDRRFLYQWI